MTDPQAQEQAPYILFADDDPDTLQLLEIYAKQRGWRVDVATRAREVISKVNEHCGTGGPCYDAIVTDINFADNVHLTEEGPRITGVTAVKEIRREYPEVPVVFYTAFDTTMVREQAQKAGGEASDYVVKSRPDSREEWEKNEFDRLLDRVAALLDWVRRRKPSRAGSERRRIQDTASEHTRRRQEGGPALGVPRVIEKALAQVRGAIKGSSG